MHPASGPKGQGRDLTRIPRNLGPRFDKGKVDLFGKPGQVVLAGIVMKIRQDVKDPVVAHETPGARAQMAGAE